MTLPRLSTILTTFIALMIASSLILIAYQNQKVEELLHLTRDENAELKNQVANLQMDNDKLSKKLDCISQLLVKDTETEDIKRIELENCIVESEKIEQPQPESEPAPKKEQKGGSANEQDEANDVNPPSLIENLLKFLGLSVLIGGIIILRRRKNAR